MYLFRIVTNGTTCFLRWAIHLNVTVIPRSHDPRHILLNFKALDIELSKEEIKLITEEWLPSSAKKDDETERQSDSLETSEPGNQESLETEEKNDGNDNHVTNVESKDEL